MDGVGQWVTAIAADCRKALHGMDETGSNAKKVRSSLVLVVFVAKGATQPTTDGSTNDDGRQQRDETGVGNKSHAARSFSQLRGPVCICTVFLSFISVRNPRGNNEPWLEASVFEGYWFNGVR